ncbi:MAG TPA: DUF488 family protein [Rhizomicrobium sp.]|nr:DUF488 family protein [Rhizomicrobium sp.]
MAIRIVRLGTPRQKNEGLRIGTVRRPPRGVPKSEFAKRDFYDVWLPMLSPGEDLVAAALRAQRERDAKAWSAFTRKFRVEMAKPQPSHLLDLLAALSHRTDLAVGCYCEDEAWCHRAVLRELLAGRGASIAP